jgi:thiamine transport system substrate-binding protein
MNRLPTVPIAAVLLGLVACGGPTTTPTPMPASSPTTAPDQLTLLTHDSFAVSDQVLADFTAQSGVTIKVLRAGDAGSMANQAILTKDNPLADVLYGIDNAFLSRALDAGIFQPYHASGVDSLPAALKLDARERVTPIDYGDVCINYDKSAYGDSNPPPQTLADLTKPQYKSQLVVEDPGTSSPGLAFLLATIAEFPDGEDYTWQDYWRDLRANDVAIVSGWEEAYEGTFSGGSGTGDRPLVVSYATSPVAEVYYASPRPTESPTGVLTDGCFRQVEFAGVLEGTAKPAHAQEFVDFMLGQEFQADIPLNMFVFPALPNAAVPDVFSSFAVNVPQPLTLPPDQIAANRDQWLNEWSAAVH